MATYKEVEGEISRDYALKGNYERYLTQKAVFDVVPTKEFGTAFFLDGELQMAQQDEYMYHEMLVHPAMLIHEKPVDVCILGGGDGYAAREVLKWRTVKSIDIFDWDKTVIDSFQTSFSGLNNHSLDNPKVKIHIQDVLQTPLTKKYDVLIVDLVDPNCEENESKQLWSALVPKLRTLLSNTGSLVINAGGIYPWRTRNVEWLQLLISGSFQENETHTLEAYKCFVPSFASEWCFLLIRPGNSIFDIQYIDNKISTRYFDQKMWLSATLWSKEYAGILATERTKLSGYLPQL